MQITSIKQAQNTNFKALYKPENSRLTETQQQIIKDIEIKLGERISEKDYKITPYGGFAVALYQVEGRKENPYKTDDLLFEKSKLCAICDEKNPLNLSKLDIIENDFEFNENKGCLNTILSFLAASLTVLALSTGILALKNNKNITKNSIEFVNKLDTLNNISPKTLDLTKQLIKK